MVRRVHRYVSIGYSCLELARGLHKFVTVLSLDAAWAVIIVLIAMAIGTATMVRNRDVAYGLVLIWAYIGILIRQISADGLAGHYPAIIGAVIVSLVIYVVVEIVILRDRNTQAAVPA